MIIQNNKTVHLLGKNVSYVLVENDEGDLLNFHFGPKIVAADYAAQPELWEEAYPRLTNTYNLSSYPQEYPAFGHNDTRIPAYQVENKFGNLISKLRVKEYRIHAAAVPEIPQLPCLFGAEGTDTLEVVLEDSAIGLEVSLFYTVFEELDVIARSAVLTNRSDSAMTLNKALSCNLDLPERPYEMIWFPGEWGRERGLQRIRLEKGIRMEAADNAGRGSREVNPFVMVASAGADEEQGQVYGFHLIYSGNHATQVQVSANGKVRIQQGISPESFAWTLRPGESFHTPQSVLCYSDSGFGGISHQYHTLYREHLMRSRWTKKHRPVLLNNWEATYFDFNEEKLLELAQKAKSIGIELFVLDDGWFGKRNNAESSLGDWVVNRKKLPSGIDGLAKKIRDMDMLFGLWFEPEMISPDSELYRNHPDWAIRVPNIEPAQQRWQYVLDLTRQEVRDHVVEAVSTVLDCGDISYVKWDMNRNLYDVPGKGFYHRYTLGYYDIMRRITERFPEVLFEGCASGGGRFDPGVLAYMPQIWTSDNSDAVSRLKIQYATSMCYPLSSMGAHVSAVPNHQVGRLASLKTRADVAYAGVFGYELDITQMAEEELQQMMQQIAFSKHIQPLIHNGRFYRLRSPFEANECAWEVVSEGKNHVFVMACRVLSVIRRQYFEPNVKLKGLDVDAVYEDVATGKQYSGSLLMHRGLSFRYPLEDFATCTLELKKV